MRNRLILWYYSRMYDKHIYKDRIEWWIARRLSRGVCEKVLARAASKVWQDEVEPDKITYPAMFRALEQA